MKRISISRWASRRLERALEQSFSRSGIAVVGNRRGNARQAEERVEPRGSFMNRAGSPLLVLLLVGALLGGPSLLWAGAPGFGNSTDPNTIAQADSSGQDGRRSQDKPSRPNGDSGKSAGDDGNPGPRPQHPVPLVRPPSNNHPPSHPWPRPPAYHHPQYGPGWPNYAWGSGNGWRLHRFFVGDRYPGNQWHRHHFYPGTFFPRVLVNRIQPIPQDLMVYLPPVPPGFAIGYYDGYCLLYDPFTLRIASVIDLYRY